MGFRTPKGQITTLQSFKTMQLPRMIRGKPGAWDPSVCLDWGQQFLTFLKQMVTTDNDDPPKKETVWRVVFTPKGGAKVMRLSEAELVHVVAGEERVGFLPRFYWNELVAGLASGVVDSRNRMPTTEMTSKIASAVTRGPGGGNV